MDTDDLSPLAQELVRQFGYLLNKEAAEKIADVADGFYHYRCARVHGE